MDMHVQEKSVQSGVDLLRKAKLFVAQHPLFMPQPKQALAVALHPFDKEIATWLVKKNVEQIAMVRYAVEFFIGLYLRDVVTKRAPGLDGVNPVNNAPIRLCKQAEHNVWCNKVSNQVQDMLVYMDKFMFTYLCAATAGELRHALSKGKGIGTVPLAKWNILVNGEVQARAETQASFLKELAPEQAGVYLAEATKLFRDYTWSASYGGKKWSDICATGRDRARNELDAVLFIDRVFDLKHNGGPMFDKNSIVTQSSLPNFLDAKFALTNDAAWTPWLKYLSKETVALLDEGRSCKLWLGGTMIDKTKLPETMKPKLKAESQGELDLPSEPPPSGVHTYSNKNLHPNWEPVTATPCTKEGHGE